MRIRDLFATISVGLDVQADAVRLVQIDKKQQQKRVNHYAAVSLQHHVFNGDMVEYWEGLRDALEELVIVAGVRMATVAVNFPASLLEIAWHKVLESKNRQECEVMLRKSVNRHYLQKYVACIREAGLKPRIVDLDIFALQRVVQFNIKNEEEWLGVLYLQTHRTMLVVTRGDTISCYRVWHRCLRPDEISSELMNLETKVERVVLFNTKHASACLPELHQDFTVNVLWNAEAALFAVAAGLAMRRH